MEKFPRNKGEFTEEKATGKVIGIDLGTTNSVVSVIEGGEPVVFNAEGNRTTIRGGVYGQRERLVGQVAKRQAITNPKRTCSLPSALWDEYNEASS